MDMSLPSIRRAITAQPWAILPDRAADIAAVIERRVMGQRLDPEAIAAVKGMRTVLSSVNGSLLRVMGGAGDLLAGVDALDGSCRQIDAAAGGGGSMNGTAVGVINIHGIIAQHARQVDDVSGPGGTSTERIGAALQMALADPTIGAIVLNIDSPGGSVFGVQAVADQIFAARGQKPIIAQANSLAASAAYWIASAADEIVVTPGGQVGSIGVVSLHEDWSVAAEKVGVKYTFIHAGKFKVEGNSMEPLGAEARDAIQADVDAYYRDFVRAVARNRGVKVADVTGGFGQARTLKDADAVKERMADRTGTLDATIRRAIARPGGKGGPRGMVPGATLETDDEIVAALAGEDAPVAPPQAAQEPDAPAPAATALADLATALGGQETGAAVDDTDRDRDAWRRRRHAHLMRRHG